MHGFAVGERKGAQRDLDGNCAHRLGSNTASSVAEPARRTKICSSPQSSARTSHENDVRSAPSCVSVTTISSRFAKIRRSGPTIRHCLGHRIGLAARRHGVEVEFQPRLVKDQFVAIDAIAEQLGPPRPHELGGRRHPPRSAFHRNFTHAGTRARELSVGVGQSRITSWSWERPPLGLVSVPEWRREAGPRPAAVRSPDSRAAAASSRRPSAVEGTLPLAARAPA